MKLIECVPNFSEGRRKEVMDAIVNEARSSNVKILDFESDADHNRSVLTFIGSPEAAKQAALAVSAKAIELIDLNQHRGQHPRMGAVDVVPFIPISDVSMEECIQLAKDFAAEYAARFKVPVFLYEEATTKPDRKDLADVRKGEFEGLREQIGKIPEKAPDFGPNKIHPTAGATAVGARQILIAYNINLATNRVDVAKQIARQVRGRDGGLSAVKALGFELKDRGIVQVSMNMVDYKSSQLFKVFELVHSLAEHHGVSVLNSEIVGLVPMEALTDTAEFYLHLDTFSKDQILERKLAESKDPRLVGMDLVTFANDVASEKPAPGGGSVSAYAGALAASLVAMVSRLTLKKPEYQEYWAKAEGILKESDRVQKRLLFLVDEDSKSFSNLMHAYRMPKTSQEEKRARSAEIQIRLKAAVEVPLETAEQAARALSQAESLAEFGNESALSDLQTAAYLAHSSIQGAFANVNINLQGIRDSQYCDKISSKVNELQNNADQNRSQTIAIVSGRMAKKS